jgi:hypothetical protein
VERAPGGRGSREEEEEEEEVVEEVLALALAPAEKREGHSNRLRPPEAAPPKSRFMELTAAGLEGGGGAG